MKFLVHGNAPHVKTGYGVQIAQLIERLRDDGHDPAVSSTYGIQGSALDWKGFRVYGCGYDTNSNDLIHQHAKHWFNNEPGWIVTVIDVWPLKNPVLAAMNVAAWVPIDHFTTLGPQPNVMEFFERTNAVPVAMSRFGEQLLARAGLDPVYVPLSVDTDVYKPTPVLSNGLEAREMMGVPEDAFVVSMVAMNKGWARDRKGFNEAFWGFSQFDREHPEANAYLYVHSEQFGGAEGIDLVELAIHAGVEPHKIKWSGGPDQYGYRLGYTDEMMAAVYTGTDVLLAPSHGEGFCVPLIEAHACGTPTIATNFSAQTELVPEGTGWLVEGQPEWDPAHRALYKCPYVDQVVLALEKAFEADRASMAEACRAHGESYDTRLVYETYWKPFIAELEAAPEDVLRDPMPETDAVAVLVPIYKRTENVAELMHSFVENTPSGAAELVFIVDRDDQDAQREVAGLIDHYDDHVSIAYMNSESVSCAAKWNRGYDQTTQPWVLCVGDDVRFHPGWLDAPRELSDRFDVIGTNDTAGAPKNPKVANGTHADHFFVRRAYVDEVGASLEGPGVLAPECYRHWYVDMEIIKLARARGVFAPCLDSVIEHLHPGYDGNEKARQDDPTYMVAVEHGDADRKVYADRLPLIEQQRIGRARL
jgi:glycosyltransferase involved in cell wall biosynthesis